MEIRSSHIANYFQDMLFYKGNDELGWMVQIQRFAGLPKKSIMVPIRNLSGTITALVSNAIYDQR